MSYETNAYQNQPAKAEDLAAIHLPDQQPPSAEPSNTVPLTAEDMQRINEGRIAFGLDPFPFTPPAATSVDTSRQSLIANSQIIYETNPTQIEPVASSNNTVENTPKIAPETHSGSATVHDSRLTAHDSPSDLPNAERPTPNAFPPDAPVTRSPGHPVSPARLAANRENAKKSTGPKTKKGKARSSRNAILHGLTAEKEINSTFDYKGEFKEFQHHIYRQLEPTNTLELALVDRLVSIMWRLRRIPSMETTLIDFHVEHQEPAAALGRTEARSFTNIARYESHLDRSLHRTLKELKEARETRRAVPYPLRSMKQLDEEDRLWAIADEMNAEQDALAAAHFASRYLGSSDVSDVSDPSDSNASTPQHPNAFPPIPDSPISEIRHPKSEMDFPGHPVAWSPGHPPPNAERLTPNASGAYSANTSTPNTQYLSPPNAERPTPNAFFPPIVNRNLTLGAQHANNP